MRINMQQKWAKYARKYANKKHISSVLTALYAMKLDTLGLKNQQMSPKMSLLVIFAKVE